MTPLYKKKVDTELLEPGNRRLAKPQKVSVSKYGMVTTAHYRATELAFDVLSAGGNAMDAAVTAAFALGVCEPAASGLGGQTMILLYDAQSRKKIALDGSSRAPHRIVSGESIKSELLRGYNASTVPSTPAVLSYALKNYGSLSLKEILGPVIGLAKNGYEISQLQYDLTKRELKHLRSNTSAPLFLKKGKNPYSVGSLFKQEKLAGTLERIATAGVEDFYLGDIAQVIEADMIANDGLIRADDLAQIPWPVERRPLTTSFENTRVFSMCPPGAGRVLIAMLNILSHFSPKQRDPDTPRGALLLANVIRQVNLDRQDRPIEPNLYHQIENELMRRPEYAKYMSKKIKKKLKGKGETTHLSVVDRYGNAVSLTQSIERVYGSFCATAELGFLYNNYMSAFEYNDITHPHYLRPNAVPWASVSPTIIFRGRKPWLVIGSPGSERIASTIVQVLLRLNKHSPYEAVAAPRLFCSLKGKVSLEASRMRDDIPDMLASKGFEIDVRDPYSFYLGCVQMIMRNRRGEYIGVADPRRDGSAKGPKQ
ncbi:MAG: gamma-glutamyltransferase [Candidatus Brocadiales bacterium]|nr:gamma-glutamyltransferase [Candidatus Brocadiales bacterium]